VLELASFNGFPESPAECDCFAFKLANCFASGFLLILFFNALVRRSVTHCWQRQTTNASEYYLVLHIKSLKA